MIFCDLRRHCEFPCVDFPVGAQFDGIAQLQERRENRVQMEPACGFALLGPRIRVVERMVGDVPAPGCNFIEGEPPEVEEFCANEECVLREGACAVNACAAGFCEAGCRLVYTDDGNVRVLAGDIQRAFARAAT